VSVSDPELTKVGGVPDVRSWPILLKKSVNKAQ
jgi:hypothetical protein